jgi:alkylation response protein AidB-like acyl-CoA dehydrogenase
MAAGYTPGHLRHPGEVTMAQLLTQRASFELMDVCLQIHGGAGYMGSTSSSMPRATRASARSAAAATSAVSAARTA